MGEVTMLPPLTQEPGRSATSSKPQNEFTDSPFISQANFEFQEFQATKQANETTPSTTSDGKPNVQLASNIVVLSTLIIFTFY